MDNRPWYERHSAVAGQLRRPSEALLARARELRASGTPAEAIVWECLRDRRLSGLKFRRQHTVGPFIADFYCDKARLVIELDGPVHRGTRRRDAERDAWIEQQGLRVLRVANEDVLDNVEAVLGRVLEVAHRASPSGVVLPENWRCATTLPRGHTGRGGSPAAAPRPERGQGGRRTEPPDEP